MLLLRVKCTPIPPGGKEAFLRWNKCFPVGGKTAFHRWEVFLLLQVWDATDREELEAPPRGEHKR